MHEQVRTHSHHLEIRIGLQLDLVVSHWLEDRYEHIKVGANMLLRYENDVSRGVLT
ncbi:hypothetical protein Natgr_0265 [Natronobacterium gregoryi SP2]|uniref:Uncharacterized protein n=1 Tax=Natronobacterium gregoryi (strain ATCC 43098 / DSM 3393 / CCM 3738 / CIP 104747 / IAM 13177 / JCM 8860 / NBRC 102187 / NCIMB 2189 / SP2) TaxID=797304 RepID=L0AC96_NATGS|nr:hypothetical protein Natgr_0265 [Natronobacterium gregoryi SP2]